MIPVAEIKAARERIAPHLRRTPLTFDPALRLWLKWESQQVTGSFKPRGALNKVLALQEGELRAGLVACSAGNHGQGVALAGRVLGARVTVFVSEKASPLKIEKMRALGAEVIPVHGGYAEAEAAALDDASTSGRIFVSPYNDRHVMAGGGTLALELLEEVTARVVIIPAGGGGLLAGMGSALKQRDPTIRVIAVQSAASPFLYQAFHGGDPEAVVEEPSLADGLAGALEPGSETIPIMREVADDFMLVTEEEIARAIAYTYRAHGQVIEGAAAVSLAAVAAGRIEPIEPTVAMVTGGNIDPDRHQALVARAGATPGSRS